MCRKSLTQLIRQKKQRVPRQSIEFFDDTNQTVTIEHVLVAMDGYVCPLYHQMLDHDLQYVKAIATFCWFFSFFFLIFRLYLKRALKSKHQTKNKQKMKIKKITKNNTTTTAHTRTLSFQWFTVSVTRGKWISARCSICSLSIL